MGDGLATLLLGFAVGTLIGVAIGVAFLRHREPRPETHVGAGLPPARQRARASDLAAFADRVGVGLVSLDSERVVTAANETAHNLLGRPVPSLVGLSALAVFLDHRVDELLGRTSDGRAELEVATIGEPQRTLLLAAERRADDGWLLVASDVSELRRLQRIRSEFIDNLAHELRTPLTTVRLLTETLRHDVERDDVPPKMRERITRIDVETGHLVQMVNELLDLSRIEGGASQLQLAAVDIAAVVEAAVERLRTFAERQRVRLVVDLPSPARGDSRLPAAWGDDQRLGQVLVNLLHNAIKFSPPGTTVSVSVARAETELAVSVSDQGSGVPRADRDRVFERFYKADKARSRGPGGTGLGLAIARHIVEGHGGRIWVDSEPGKGATFTFTVPLAAQPDGG